LGGKDVPAVVGVIQARLGSTRLPAKILAPLAGRPLLELLVQRLAGARVDEWWLATTRDGSDEVTAAWGRALGLRVHRGPVEDVLARFTAIIRHRRPRWVVRVTADDPFTDAGAVDWLLEARDDGSAKGADLIHGGPGLPLGYAPQLARAEAVLEAEARIPADEPFHRAHVLSWLHVRGRGVAVEPPADWPRRPGWRWTVDTPEDLAMAQAAFARLAGAAVDASYGRIVQSLDAEPEIPATNAHVAQRSLRAG